jgi:hypothetical protein
MELGEERQVASGSDLLEFPCQQLARGCIAALIAKGVGVEWIANDPKFTDAAFRGPLRVAVPHDLQVREGAVGIPDCVGIKAKKGVGVSLCHLSQNA